MPCTREHLYGPTQGLYSARVVRHTAADVRTGGPEHQHPRHGEHSRRYPK